MGSLQIARDIVDLFLFNVLFLSTVGESTGLYSVNRSHRKSKLLDGDAATTTEVISSLQIAGAPSSALDSTSPQTLLFEVHPIGDKCGE